MKNLFKIVPLLLMLFIVSCEDLTDLDINQNPNAVAPENAEVGFLYNQIQLTFNDFFQNTWGYTSTATRMRAMTSFFYREQYSPNTFDATWRNAYSGALPDIEALENITADGSFQIEANSAKIMKAYILTTLVDLFGSVPLSEAGKGTEIISPAADDAATVYAAAEALLNEAIAGLEAADTPVPTNDLFYGGDASKWITLANTLKLRIYNNTRLTDSSAGSKMTALISAGDFIDEESEDFQFQYGSNRNNPDSRHPFYVADYENDDGGYMGNYYMWLLVGEKEIVDPRTRFYFYRQIGFFSEESIDLNEWDCVLTTTPFDQIPPGTFDHVTAVDPNIPFCLASTQGYMGRDHGNGQGIPPDGPIRVEYGIYPGGGAFDNNSYLLTQTMGTLGARGAGISPIWLSFYTDFIRAEAALTAGTGEDARALLESAVRGSLSKVLGFESLISSDDLNFVIGSNPSTGEDVLAIELLPSMDDVEAYVTKVLELYDASSDKLDVIMKEYYIALYGNGLEAYNLYRRTGKPNNMAPLIDPQAASTATFPRTMLYPSDYVNLNQKAQQRETTEQVFWDNNPAGFIR